MNGCDEQAILSTYGKLRRTHDCVAWVFHNTYGYPLGDLYYHVDLKLVLYDIKKIMWNAVQDSEIKRGCE